MKNRCHNCKMGIDGKLLVSCANKNSLKLSDHCGKSKVVGGTTEYGRESDIVVYADSHKDVACFD